MTPRPSRGDQLHGAVQLRAAVAALRAEDVAGQALRVHPDEHVRLSGHLAEDERHVLGPVDVVLVADDRELAELGRDPRLGHAVHQLLGLEPVGDELGHGDERQMMLARDISCSSGRRAIEPSALRISQMTPAGTSPASRARSTLASVWPTRCSTPPGRARSGKMWPGRRRSDGDGGGIDGDVDGGGAVAGRDAGGDAEPPLGIDAHGEGGGELLGVPLGHLGEAELIAALAGERQADEAPAVQRHEVDHLGRGELGRADEVALVLAVLVVRDDDDLAVAQVLDGLLDGAEGAHDAP